MRLIRAALAVIIGLVIHLAMGVSSSNLFRRAMLERAGWRAELIPPADYVWSTLGVELTASVLAGFIMGWVAGNVVRWASLILILLLAIIRALQYFNALDHNPHWYALVMIFTPAIGIPLGVLLKPVSNK